MTVVLLCLVVGAVFLRPGRFSSLATGDAPPEAARRLPLTFMPDRTLRRGRRSAGDLAEVVDLLAAPLRAGASTESALAAVAAAAPGREHSDLVHDLRAAALEGRAVSGVWRDFATRESSAEASFVGRAWLLSEQTGAPLAEALDCAAGVLRDRTRARQRLDAASAGPRASMGVLGLLPLTGPVMGLVFGLSPAELYGGSPAAAASLGLGLLLAGAGVLWSRALLRRAVRPGRPS